MGTKVNYLAQFVSYALNRAWPMFSRAHGPHFGLYEQQLRREADAAAAVKDVKLHEAKHVLID